jgi:hypothetical protein
MSSFSKFTSSQEQYRMKRFLPVGVLVLAAITTGEAQAADCDRACLKSTITKYVDAMVAHDPSRLPLAAARNRRKRSAAGHQRISWVA